MLRKLHNFKIQLRLLKFYPVRDKILVENTIFHTRHPVGMQHTEYNVAYLRHAAGTGNIFFYRDTIPNGIIIRKCVTSIINSKKMLPLQTLIKYADINECTS